MKKILFYSNCFILIVVFGLPVLVSGDEWKPFAQRPALMQKMEKDDKTHSLMQKSIGFKGNSAWVNEYKVTPNLFYHFHADIHVSGVDFPRRSVVSSIDWKDASGKRISQPEFPKTQGAIKDDHLVHDGIYQVPVGAVSARIDLSLRWADKGLVEWSNITFEPCDPTKPRLVKLATVNFRPKSSSSKENHVKEFVPFLEQAGKEKADIVCLGEGITIVGTNLECVDAAETIPGPTTKFLGEIANKYKMYIVAGLYERVGDIVYNTAVLMGRDGQLVGSYRKTCLPREEIEGGITPGESFPVFKTDFGTVGIMICWDLEFPEPARRLAMNGADIILLPIWGGNETLMSARAIENQIYLVTSGYDAPSIILDHTGKRIAEAKENGSVSFATVDLNKTTTWEWLGDLKSRIPREAPILRNE